MKTIEMNFVFFALLWFVLSPRALAQSAASPEIDRDRILVLENAWSQAEQHRDAEALQTLLAPTLNYVEYDGTVRDRSQLIAALKMSLSRTLRITTDSVTAYTYGRTAVTAGLRRENGVDEHNVTYVRRYRFTHIWVYRDSVWVCVASQASLLLH